MHKELLALFPALQRKVIQTINNLTLLGPRGFSDAGEGEAAGEATAAILAACFGVAGPLQQYNRQVPVKLSA